MQLVALTLSSANLNADVEFTNITPDIVMFTFDGGAASLDFDADGTPDVEIITGMHGPGVGGYVLACSLHASASILLGALESLQEIGPAGPWSAPCVLMAYWDQHCTEHGCDHPQPAGPFIVGWPSFLGVRLTHADGAHYAWLRVRVTPSGGLHLTTQLFDMGYETTPDTPIFAGAVDCPEDCNANGECDISDVIASGVIDLNDNLIPDPCEPITTVHVPADYATVAEAVAALPSNGSTILVAPGVYDETNGVNLLGRPLTIRGDGPPGSIVMSCFFDSGAPAAGVLENLRLQGVYLLSGPWRISACHFPESLVWTYGGGARFDRCRFERSVPAGDAVLKLNDGVVTNSTFVGHLTNHYPLVELLFTPTQLVNCTILGLSGTQPLVSIVGANAQLSNCIIRSTESAVFDLPLGDMPTLRYCNVSGGWSGPGEGNIDADPNFAVPPTPGVDGMWATSDDEAGDLRLGLGSPCIDAASNALVPADLFDLDADGDLTEPLPFDLAGDARFTDVYCAPDSGSGTAPIVDMGAFEADLAARPVDCNNNSMDDCSEIAAGLASDCNGSYSPDACDLASGLSQDCDGNDMPDECDPDCDGNGAADACELLADPSLDCDGNGWIDACQVLSLPALDCDGSGTIDSCDIASGQSADCDGNGVPDACQPSGPPFVGAGPHVTFGGQEHEVFVAGLGAALPTSEITIEFWQRVEGVVNQTTFSLAPHDPFNRVLAHTPWSDGGVYWDFGDFANGGRLMYLPPVSIVGSWHHFAFVASQSGQFMKIYRNGVEEATASTFSGYDGTLPDFEIGNNGDGSGSYGFHGEIDEFRIWNVARPATDIAADYAHTIDPATPGLLAYYRLDEGQGATAADLTAGQDGTLQNGAAWSIPLDCPCLGDLNDDQAIDLSDYSILNANLGTPSGATPAQGDFDADGDVDLADFGSFQISFGTLCD